MVRNRIDFLFLIAFPLFVLLLSNFICCDACVSPCHNWGFDRVAFLIFTVKGSWINFKIMVTIQCARSYLHDLILSILDHHHSLLWGLVVVANSNAY